MVDGQEGRGPPRSPPRPGQSPRANARRPAEARRRGALRADLAAVLVERPELGEVAVACSRW